METTLFRELEGTQTEGAPVIFDDQYISTGGQFYEILMGHDRMIIDIRPEAYSSLGLHKILCCHLMTSEVG